MNDKACEQCPWRKTNQGKRHFAGFYTKKNLQRLWNQIRKGGGVQSCHLTDPQHPDHVTSGANEKATAQECPGSIVLINRELTVMADEDNYIGPTEIDNYFEKRPKHGLTKSGILYWLVSRIQMGGVPFMGGPKMPEIQDDPEVGLPEFLETT